MENEVDPPQVIGYALGQATLESSARCTLGFRLFKELRARLPIASGQGLECGMTTAVHEETQSLIDGGILKELQHEANSGFRDMSKSQCEEAGDIPSQTKSSHSDRPFTLMKFLNLLITRLNLLDSSDESTCIPPAQPCIDLCQIVLTVCRMQLNFMESSHYGLGSSPNDAAFDSSVLVRRDWIGLLYMVIDSFSQGLCFFNCFLTSLNQRVLNGAWHRTGSLEDRAKIHGDTLISDLDNGFDCGSYLSSLMNNVLTCMRELLLEGKVPLKMIRSAILDTLMIASELAAVSNITYPTWPAETYELPVTESGSTESDGDEVYECYQKFLLETHQVPPS
ncbi:unnamed protein product [Echinostoma caproni]|uniref:E3 ubiquitin-protein ligase n=1 Tax=Echinostoma caproni TaxID=27848 RepID=A0A183BG25_9TREM|nr:unnamed protein product [Echinostoma caproni]